MSKTIRNVCLYAFMAAYLSVGLGLAMVVDNHNKQKGCDGISSIAYVGMTLAWPVAVGAATIAVLAGAEASSECQ